jgi:hypothetical protein
LRSVPHPVARAVPERTTSQTLPNFTCTT